MNEINLLWMYPDVLNLHGDRGNIQAFEMVANRLGVKLNIKRINNFNEEIDFENTDIMIFGPGELKSIQKISEVLNGKRDNFINFIENKKYIIAIGTTGALFANKITRENGTEFEGLNLLDMTCKERKMVIGDDIYYKINEKEIVGSQIQMIDIELNSENALADVEYGYGNNGTKKEGARRENLIFTNALGPIFVKNPWWAEIILKDIAKKKEIVIDENKSIEYELETASLETTKRFINKKINK